MGKTKMDSRHLLVCALLVLITTIVYWQVIGFDLTNFDDNKYILENPAVLAGLSNATVRWAMTANYQANWHPLTWMSLMVDTDVGKLATRLFDVDLGNNNAGVYHFTNLLLHIANTILLYLLLYSLTGSRWRSLFVAALFAVHPLHVESVAWVTERKDVLSTFFWILTTLYYVKYVNRPSSKPYLLMIAAYALGVMAKSMLVSLPLVLLLLDLWPLRRLDLSADRATVKASLHSLVAEKMPLFIIAAISCALTVWAQRAGGAVGSFANYSLQVRAANATVACISYVCKMVWPSNLAILYPHPGNSLPVWEVVGACLLLVAVTVAAIRGARVRPYVMVGWLWYLITLMPVIGLVQVGKQAMADRYTYVPLIGLFIIIAWAVPDIAIARSKARAAVAAIAVVSIAALMVSAHHVTGYWKDSITLFSNAIGVTQGNSLAYNNLGSAYLDVGQPREAEQMFRKALIYHPEYTDAAYNLGNAFRDQGRDDEAMAEYKVVIAACPGYTLAHDNLGILLAQRGKLDAAIAEFRQTLKINPNDAGAQSNLRAAIALQREGH